jgi:hypothetical protein
MADTDESGPHSTSDRSKFREWISGIAAPAILVGGATAYFAGTIYRDELLNSYGLAGTAIQWSVQHTIAYGYYALLRCFIPIVLCLMVHCILLYAVLRWRGMPKSSDRTVARGHPLIRLTRAVFLSAFFACLGWMAGWGSGAVEYRNVEETISNHCKGCYLYRTTKGQVVGTIIAQDDKTIIIATRSGVAVLAAGSIKTVKAINRRSPISRWAVL